MDHLEGRPCDRAPCELVFFLTLGFAPPNKHSVGTYVKIRHAFATRPPHRPTALPPHAPTTLPPRQYKMKYGESAAVAIRLGGFDTFREALLDIPGVEEKHVPSQHKGKKKKKFVRTHAEHKEGSYHYRIRDGKFSIYELILF